MPKQRRTATKNDVSGALRSYIHLQQKTEADDGFGNMVPGGPYETRFSVYANLRPLLRGSATGVEDIFADRLQGNQPFIATVRNNEAFKDVTTAWRVVDARNDHLAYNIKSPPTDITNGGRWLEFILVLGEAT